MTRRQWDATFPLLSLFFFALGTASGFGLALLSGVSVGTETVGQILQARGWLFALPIGVLLGAGWLLNRWVRGYRLASERLTEEIQLIGAANPAYRVSVEGPRRMKGLAQTINALAERFQHLLADQELLVEQARANLEVERNRLVALMADISEGVVVCNSEGRILLYNPPARRLVAPLTEEGNGEAEHFMGLGRSIFTLIEPTALNYALDRLTHRLADAHTEPLSFVTSTSHQRLLRGRLSPVVDAQDELTGFVLVLADITEAAQESSDRDALIEKFTQGSRPALANLRAAIETIEEYPTMTAKHRERFQGVIRDESQTLSQLLEQVVADLAGLEQLSVWRREAIPSDDLLTLLQRHLQEQTDTQATIDPTSVPCWLSVDSYSLVQAVCQTVADLQQSGVSSSLCLRLTIRERFANLDLRWRTSEEAQVALRSNNSHLNILQAVMAQHGGEVWHQIDKEEDSLFIRLLMPLTSAPPRVRSIGESRDTYYDFDLFGQASNSELDHQPLTSLSYTVFDTETTGLHPGQGDEIVSISAVRIVNGRILEDERFDQLVDPKRAIPRVATAVHGITNQMVEGQPPISEVLPRFVRFAEDTVLVAHNAAFDMRMLELKAPPHLSNPVLDTLLLSAIVHPLQELHSLEAIAQRFSVTISERHSSLGDAILTAQLFLKLIPLLAEQGIITLQDARQAAQQTYYAQIEYK